MHFLLEGPFGDFEQKPGDCNYWFFVTVFTVTINIYIQ